MASDLIIVITGLTASGKSRAALALAENLKGVVINADSMQVYQALPILTAQPTATDHDRSPHRLYATIPPAQISSAGIWSQQAAQEVEVARKENLVPILVGGTGLYLKALFQGIVDVPPISAEVRNFVRERLEKRGTTSIYEELCRADPAMAQKLRPQDTQRLVRALEVMLETGRSLLEWQQSATKAALPSDQVLLISFEPDRATLLPAIAARLAQMVERGALEEVRDLMKLNLPSDRPILRAVGFREFSSYLEGRCSQEEALAQANIASRQYAKRQKTWLRTQMRDLGKGQKIVNTQFSESFAPEILSFVRSFD